MNGTKRIRSAVGAALCVATLGGALPSAPYAAADGLGDVLGAGACALGSDSLSNWLKAAQRAKLPAALKVFTMGAATAGCTWAVKQFEADKPATFQFKGIRGQTITKTYYFDDFVNPATLPVIHSDRYPYARGGRCYGLPVGSFYDICVGD